MVAKLFEKSIYNKEWKNNIDNIIRYFIYSKYILYNIIRKESWQPVQRVVYRLYKIFMFN